jgi:murein DD-endopeptidase MepM/ murein hydrolase activator NlpD
MQRLPVQQPSPDLHAAVPDPPAPGQRSRCCAPPAARVGPRRRARRSQSRLGGSSALTRRWITTSPAMVLVLVAIVATLAVPGQLPPPAFARGAAARGAAAQGAAAQGGATFRPPVARRAGVPGARPAGAPAARVGAASRSLPVMGQRAPDALQAPSRVPLLHPPVDGLLLRGFEEIAGPYGPGHRGVDVGAAPGASVRAPASGRVTFAGRVAGATWVTIEVAPAVLVTVGPLRGVATSVGREVTTGAPVGTLAPGHPVVDRSPAPGGSPRAGLAALHLGLRVSGVYVDPLPWLAGLARPRLAPLAEPGGPH